MREILENVRMGAFAPDVTLGCLDFRIGRRAIRRIVGTTEG